jgi:hypothetical protein
MYGSIDSFYLREFTKVMTNHFRADFDLVESLTVVDTNDGTDHFRDDDHVTQVGLDGRGLFARGGFSLGLAKLLDETHGLALQTTLESSTGTAVDQIHELFRGQVEELIEIDTTVAELAESSLSLGRLVSLKR